MISLFLRCNGSLDMVVNQLEGIGSEPLDPEPRRPDPFVGRWSREGPLALPQRQEKFGLKALLLGEVNPDDLAMPADEAAKVAAAATPAKTAFKVKCPQCNFDLAFQEGCVKCHSCGFSQC